MTTHPDPVAGGPRALLAFLDASPTPFHAVETARGLLTRAGFAAVDEAAPWPRTPGRHVLVRGGSLVAWVTREGDGPETPFRIVGTHTDSPNLRVKPHPDHTKAGWQMLGVEPYGGLLQASWLDRDLGLAGRVAVRTPTGVQTRLFHERAPVARVAQLAVHLDRGVNERGLVLDPQQHLVPLWARQPGSDFAAWVGDQVGAERADVLAWDAMFHDVQGAAILGRDGEFLASARLDNLASSYAALRALLAAAGDIPVDTDGPATDGGGAWAAYRPVVVLFDHEEVGSRSERGADSPLLPAVLERIVLAAGGDRDDYWRALAASVVASADMAHATHPNYADRHEPQHQIAMNGGPVLKVHTELRYASDAVGAAVLRLAAEQAGVALQTFVVRSDLPCGSTIGPITAAGVGVSTVDLGAPLLSMHSIRELAGVPDQRDYAALLAAFLAPAAR